MTGQKGYFKELVIFLSLLFIPLFPSLFTALKLSYLAFNNSPDTFLYLDIARNFLKGHGLVTSFNVYQYWAGLFHPAVPFVHVLFSLYLSLLYFFFPSVQKLVLFNFIFAFINSYLIYQIVKKIYSDIGQARWVACLVAATVSMQITLLRLLTEQLSLCILLLAAYYFISRKSFSKKGLLLLGVILGFGFFVRSAAIVYPLIFFLAFLFAKNDGVLSRGQGCRAVLFWPFIIIVSYELVVYWFFGSFTPRYPEAFKNYYLATFTYGGNFFRQAPVVRPSDYLQQEPYYFYNLRDMAVVLYCQLRFLLFFVFLRIFKVIKQRDKNELLFFWLAVVPAFATVLIYPFMRVAEFQWTRFLIVPVIAMAMLGVREWKFLTDRFFPRTKKIIFHAVLGVVFLSNFYQSTEVLKIYWKKEEATGKVTALRNVIGWVKSNIDQEELVAVSLYLIGRADLERPVVILPLYNMLNYNNLKDFVSIYTPRAVIFENTMPDSFKLDLVALGYRQAPDWSSAELFVIYIQNLPRLSLGNRGRG